MEWPLSPLLGEEFLKVLESPDRIDAQSYHQRMSLTHRTVVELCVATKGFYGCSECMKEGRLTITNLEGHHTSYEDSKPPYYLSSYLHNQTGGRRKAAMDRLRRELTRRLVLLCKYHHEKAHHGRKVSLAVSGYG